MISIRLLIKCNYLTIDGYKDKEKYRERKEISMVFWWGRGRGHHLSEPCVFCSSVFYCEKKNIGESCEEFYLSQRTFLSLTDLTDLTELFGALFRSHRTPPAYREHRGLTPNPSPNGEGSSMRGYPYWPADRRRIHTNHTEDIQGYLGDHSPLHSERGWG